MISLIFILIKTFLIGVLFCWYIMRPNKMEGQEKFLFAVTIVMAITMMFEITFDIGR